MLRRHQLVWKVNGVFLVILVCVLGTSGYVTNVMYEGAALASARDFSRVHSGLILQNIRELMLRQHPRGLGELLDRLATDSALYSDIRVVAHSGRVVATRPALDSVVFDPESWPCSVCHTQAGLFFDSTVTTYAEVVEIDNGERIVSVVTPVLREEGCTTSECHSAADGAPILAVLQADFSLRSVDDLIAKPPSEWRSEDQFFE